MITSHEREFSQHMEQFRRELQVHCYRLLGSLQDAEDAVQETMLRAWHGRSSLQTAGALRAWLYRIATNYCLDVLKRNRKRYVPMTYQAMSTLDTPIPKDVNEPIWLEPYPDDWLLTGDQSPEERLMGREHITLAFITALQHLPPRQRAVLLLRDVLGWQADEIATLLGTTISAVKSALHRARVTLSERKFAPSDVWTPNGAMQQQLDQYIRAWEAADIDALVSLLREDAIFSMPPIPAWYQGKVTIAGLVAKTVFAGEAIGRWRLRPARANGQTAFGLYRRAGAGYDAYGIQVLTISDGLISDIITFRIPNLCGRFGLPAHLPETS